MTFTPRQNVALGPLTTLDLGGPARFFVEAQADAQIDEALAWATGRGIPAFVLGSGSNTIVPDAGFEGLVLRVCTRGITGKDGVVTVAAGESWDEVVIRAVDQGLGGLECLSGIPGTAGATPVQNVGAYGQEVSETIVAVRALDRTTGQTRSMDRPACGFSYRDSVFKRQPGRFVVREVTFALNQGAAPTLRYAELRAALAGTGTSSPSLADARMAVLGLRRRKSMVIEASNPQDPNRRSVGSFFTNPLLPEGEVTTVIARARAAGVLAADAEPPHFPAGPGQQKLAAAWLIEKAGFHKGERRGPVGLSSAHALALVHHGGGRTADLLAFAREIRGRVEERFGVTLLPEPVVMGSAPGTDPLANAL